MVVAAMVAAACGGAAPAAEAPASSGIDPATAAVVTGRVMFEGPAPEPEMLADRRRPELRRRSTARASSPANPSCSARTGAAERLRLRQGRAWQAGLSRCRPSRSCSISRSAATCRACSACGSASRWQIRNSDPLLHNVRVERRDQPALRQVARRSQGMSVQAHVRDARSDGAVQVRRARAG